MVPVRKFTDPNVVQLSIKIFRIVAKLLEYGNQEAPELERSAYPEFRLQIVHQLRFACSYGDSIQPAAPSLTTDPIAGQLSQMTIQLYDDVAAAILLPPKAPPLIPPEISESIPQFHFNRIATLIASVELDEQLHVLAQNLSASQITAETRTELYNLCKAIQQYFEWS